jgi:ribosome biogenesis protein BMS1
LRGPSHILVALNTSWRLAHPYLVADRFEDVTPEEAVRVNPKCDREVALFGYLRGANLKRGQRIHLAGVGDLDVSDITVLPDPCPLPDTIKKKGLNDKEKLLYALTLRRLFDSSCYETAACS